MLPPMMFICALSFASPANSERPGLSDVKHLVVDEFEDGREHGLNVMKVTRAPNPDTSYCGCQFSMMANREQIAQRYLESNGGNPGGVMPGLSNTGQEFRKWVLKSACDGSCSLTACKRALLTGVHSDLINGSIPAADVDDGLFEVNRAQVVKMADGMPGLGAYDCKNYKPVLHTCECTQQTGDGNLVNWQKTQCHHFKKQGSFTELIRDMFNLPYRTDSCTPHACSPDAVETLTHPVSLSTVGQTPVRGFVQKEATEPSPFGACRLY